MQAQLLARLAVVNAGTRCRFWSTSTSKKKSGSPSRRWVGITLNLLFVILSLFYFLCRGSNASRNPSPKKFNASKVLPIAIAGKTSNHQ